MTIQSLSILVPWGCLNNCYFCVSKMDNFKERYNNHIQTTKEDMTNAYKLRMSFVRESNCNVVILTWQWEPLLNRKFLSFFAQMNKKLKPSPFKCIEIQTSWVTLDDEYLKFLKEKVNITTISLSVSDIFSSSSNTEYNRTKKWYEVDIDKLCDKIKRHNFNLRLSLNMTDKYDKVEPYKIFERAWKLSADQITFRVLYTSSYSDCPQNKWIKEHWTNTQKLKEITNFIEKNGIKLNILPFWATQYSVNWISTLVDDDSMNGKLIKWVSKYLILRPNCKLYTHWNDPASLVF